MEIRTFKFTENGFSMTDGTVQIPECIVKAESYVEAVNKLSTFLKTKERTNDIELITPLDRINFESNEAN